MADTMSRQALAEWLDQNGITSVEVQATNLDGTFVGKTLSRDKFLGGLEQGFAFADVVFGNDLSSTPVLGMPFPSWRGEMADIFLRPDLDTLCEWKPGRAAVIGGFHLEDGTPVAVCPRNLLRRVDADARRQGFTVATAIEIEATVFAEPVTEARTRGYAGLTPLGGSSGSAYVLARDADWHAYLERVEERLREIGIAWEAWNDEAAAGQIEINIAVGDVVAVADGWARCRQVMREVAHEQGRTVTFMAKWSDAWGQGSHLNLSLATTDDGNAFFAEDGVSPSMGGFLGGVMAALPGTTSIALPFITSYRRLIPGEGPPTTVSWGVGNKSAAVRAVTGHPKQSRIEYRVPGADANMYLVSAAVLGAGLVGVRTGMEPPAPCEGMAWFRPDSEPIPTSISLAADAIETDKILLEALGREFVSFWTATRRWEWLSFHTQTEDDPDAGLTGWERHRYFELA